LSDREEEEQFEVCEEEDLQEQEDEGSMVDYGGLIRTFLSPIVELVRCRKPDYPSSDAF